MVTWPRLLLFVVILLIAGPYESAADERQEGKRLGNVTVQAAPIEISVELYDANPNYWFRELALALYPDLFPNERGTGLSFAEQSRNLGGGRLFALQESRAGTVADGESRLLVAVTVSAPGIVTFRLRQPPDGSDGNVGTLESTEDRRNATGRDRVEMPTIADGVAPDGVFRAYALYVPPRAFNPAGTTTQKTVKSPNGRDLKLDIRTVGIDIGWKEIADRDVQVETLFPIISLLRPPVVLIHGTYDSAKAAWNWPEEGEWGGLDKYTKHAKENSAEAFYYTVPNFAHQLETLGFAVFLVNYESTNGVSHPVAEAIFSRGKAISSGVPEIAEGAPFSSYFSANAKVVWDGGRMEPVHEYVRGQGIRQALDFFRDKLNVAATKADVVGHSMGGVLARVYARGVRLSEPYDRPGENWYRRVDNWYNGDINRLITIGSTHKGSHVPRLATHYWKNNIVPPLTRAGWQVRTWFQVGDGAFSDQYPDSQALQSLGPTRVPTHTIAAVGTRKDLDKFDFGFFDPSYRGRFMLTWQYTNPDNVATIFNNHAPPAIKDRSLPGVEDAQELKTMMMLALELRKKALRINERFQDLLHMAMTPQLRREWDDLVAELKVTEEQIARQDEQAFLRYVGAAFWNDYTDFTTSLDSALNGQDPASKFVTVLPDNYRVACEGILHGYEPRHKEVQTRVIQLLTGGMDEFAPGLDGFKMAAYRDKKDPRRWTPSEPDDSKCQPPQWTKK